MEKEYSTFQVVEAIGEKYQRLRGWIDAGTIVPSIQRADGIGGRAKFSKIDVYCIGLFKELLSLGFTRDEAGKRVKGVRSYLSGFKIRPGDLRDPKSVEHLLIVRYGDSFLTDYEQPGHKPKMYSYFGEALKATAKEPLRIMLLSQQMFEELSLSELFKNRSLPSSVQQTDGAKIYSAIVIINFGQIVRAIDEILG